MFILPLHKSAAAFLCNNIENRKINIFSLYMVRIEYLFDFYYYLCK